MHRKDLAAGISMSDLGAGEFGYSWYSYGVVYEFLTFGIPVMHNRNDNEYKNIYPEMYPMYSADSAEKITEILNKFAENPEQFKETGLAAQNWFRKYAVEKPLEQIIDAVNKKFNA